MEHDENQNYPADEDIYRQHEELTLENKALRYGAGDMSSTVVRMARGLVDEDVDIDAAIKQVMSLMKLKTRDAGYAAPTIASTGGRHGTAPEAGINQAAYDRNKHNGKWLNANKQEIFKAMFEGRLK